FFTSSGTESNNLAIMGFAAQIEKTGRPLSRCHFMTSAIEHPSVRDCFKELERRGARVSYIPVDKDGILDLRAFGEELGPKTVFISVMLANNEIGTIQPIGEIARLVRAAAKNGLFAFRAPGGKESKPLLHTDASQAPLYLPTDAKKLGVDLLTLDAQKIYGPKGVGVLYRKTLAIARDEWESQSVRLTKLRDECIRRILEVAPQAVLNGSSGKRLPNNINISFLGKDAEWILFQLDARGIAVGTRSACMSAKEPGSYVVAALGQGKEYATGSIRITLGRWTTQEDIDALIAALKEIFTPVCSRCGTPMPDIPTTYAHQDGSACHDIKRGNA
ncbi:MAG: aminotransferase class V-fold PLP-dependent enzyme, partial [Parcubacteria group bacterium]|nr:aminotransferase class V-fold PLP-dependent enzyme [Parcubacteria group bacterium]